jgi:RNA polymerase sigma-70 factor (ECF subfamily)
MDATKVTADLPMSAMDEPNAVRAHGARPSFDQVFRDEAANVGRTLRYLGVGEAGLEDACQEVFVVVHRRLAQLETSSARAWVRQICVHVARNQRRSLRRRREVVCDPPEVAVPPPQESAIERRAERDRLLAILDALPEDQRAVFVLYEIEELAMAEIASAVGCALQTAYSRLQAARGKVEKAIKSAAAVQGAAAMDAQSEPTSLIKTQSRGAKGKGTSR